MTMLHTIQGTYEPLRDAITSADATVGPGDFDFSSKPSHAFQTDEAWNGLEMIFKFPSGAVANEDVHGMLYGWVQNGPRERIAEISVTAGTATIGGVATALWGDTIVLTSLHINTVSVTDSANNTVAKLAFDLAGLKYVAAEFTVLSAAGAIQTLARPI